MTLDLDNLRKLEAAATPGPWEYGTAMCCPDAGWVDGPAGKGKVCPQYEGTKTTHTLDANDAELIAEMRNALPLLLADHARLVAARDAAIVRVAALEHALKCACAALHVHSPIVADAVRELAAKEPV